MSNSVRRSRVIDLRKRKPGPAQETRRTIRLELPVHRRSSLRIRRRKLQTLLALIILLMGAGAVYGLSVLTYLPQYTITKVSVGGTEHVPPRLVQAFVEAKLSDGTYHLLSRENIFLYPKKTIAKSIPEYFPRILNAQISRDALMAQVINVVVVERQPFALWCSQTDTCFDMDNGGFVFALSATSTDGRIVFTGGLATSSPPIGQTFLPQHFAGVLALVSHLKERGYSVADVSVENEQDFAVSLAERFVLRASFGADADSLVQNLQAVLSSGTMRGKEDTIEYIDLRFGNRVYYKNKASSQ